MIEEADEDDVDNLEGDGTDNDLGHFDKLDYAKNDDDKDGELSLVVGDGENINSRDQALLASRDMNEDKHDYAIGHSAKGNLDTIEQPGRVS